MLCTDLLCFHVLILQHTSAVHPVVTFLPLIELTFAVLL